MNLFDSPSRKVFNVVNYIILIAAGLTCLLPFVNLLAISFSDSGAVAAGRVSFWPVNFTISSYAFAFTDGKFFPALFISIERVVLGVAVNLLFMIMAAYPLSKNKHQFRARNGFMVYFIITMIIGGGLIPTYILVSRLKLLNSIWALILPGALPVWTMVILMNFMRQMPQEIEEAAIVDGAGVWRRLFGIMLPLLKPPLATVSLFCAVGHWNDWFSGLIYMQSPSKYPLQTYLQGLLLKMDEVMRISGSDYMRIIAMMSIRTGRAAQLFMGALPMMILYPFLQKYFTKGLVVGSVKG
ncbi:MAG: carbohydrate ABC transporter permease [Treponema sp.]|jgi:putative aldouronate transport system permease protein|nr:carbohydrate ABC transporter permease [Treponema sp.]